MTAEQSWELEAGAQDGGAGEEAAAAGDDGDRTGEWGLGGRQTAVTWELIQVERAGGS